MTTSALHGRRGAPPSFLLGVLLSKANAGTWVKGTSTLPKVFDQPNGSKLELLWKDKQPVGPRKHPSLFSESIGVLMATSRRFNWTKNWELQDVGHKQWLWDNIKAISERNKANRAKQIAKHAAGRISFPQFEEIMSKEHGAPLSLGDLFVRTHTSSKTHDALDDQSRDYIDKMNHLAGRDEHGAQLPLTNEIYREVMPPERHGRVRLRGRGVTPTSYFGSRLSSDNRVNDLENQVVEMKRVAEEKEEERQREIEEMRRQAQDKDEQRQLEMDEMKRQFDA
ncbi:hypothetical protein IFM89_036447 [Coptis chinensis]|uniref:Uncharacterized protein n=1 Tax=Coptis chinensis TaxID=261450 RepID=A0A835I0I6_9MAGN|nr:hypothetical protein IFM89_036447 [Coptis chinensis]